MSVPANVSADANKPERGRKKRGGDGNGRVSLNAAECVTEENIAEILTFDEAICRMEEQPPEAARKVRPRFYTGLSVAGTANVTIGEHGFHVI